MVLVEAEESLDVGGGLGCGHHLGCGAAAGRFGGEALHAQATLPAFLAEAVDRLGNCFGGHAEGAGQSRYL